MIERLTNCPNCSGVLDDSGRCKFCGSKVYDFLSIDFTNGFAKTYIRIKAQNKIIVAPVICPNAEITTRDLCYDYFLRGDDGTYIRPTPCWETEINTTFRVVGDVLVIKENEL